MPEHDVEPIQDIGELYKRIEMKKKGINLERKYWTGWFDALEWVQNLIDGTLKEV
jgi:hypothetical protein